MKDYLGHTMQWTLEVQRAFRMTQTMKTQSKEGSSGGYKRQWTLEGWKILHVTQGNGHSMLGRFFKMTQNGENSRAMMVL